MNPMIFLLPLFSFAADSVIDATKEGTRQIIRSHLPEVKKCYTSLLERKKDAEGKIVLEWDYDAEGIVTKSKVKSSDDRLKESEFETCLLSAVKTWKFDPPPRKSEGKKVTAGITYPFYFKPDPEKKK